MGGGQSGGGGCGCNAAVGAQASERVVWLQGQFLSFTGGDLYLTADQWLDCSEWMDAFIALEFSGTGGSSLTALLQTAVAPSDLSAAWASVTSASGTLTNGVLVLKAPGTLAVPPAGVLRLKFTAAAAVAGTVRAVVCFKQRG